MSMLMMLRMQIKVEYIENIDLAKLRHGLYPPTKFDPDTNEYAMSFDTINAQLEKLTPFMMNGNVTTDKEAEGYIPMLDVTGPLMYFPPHCVELKESLVFESPVIAYIKSDSII
jgi:hypothetical protein